MKRDNVNVRFLIDSSVTPEAGRRKTVHCIIWETDCDSLGKESHHCPDYEPLILSPN